MKLTLHDYQVRALDFILSQYPSYVMIDVGLGKTAIALHAIKYLKKPAIVLAPLRVATIAWPDEIKKWTPELRYQVLYGKHKNFKFKIETDIKLLSFSTIRWFYEKVHDRPSVMRNHILIIDEASMVKDSGTQRWKMIKALLPLFRNYRIALSATPSPNGYQDLWSQYYLLDDGERLGKSFYAFRAKYFNFFGPPTYKLEMRPDSDKKIFDAIEDITFRLEGKDYLELPKVIYNKVKVRLPSKQMDRYNELEREFLLDLGEKQIAAFSSSALSIKLRQFVQGALYYDDGPRGRQREVIHEAKIEALKELLEIHSGTPILCAVQFQFEYEMIRRMIGKAVPIIAGMTSVKQSAFHIRDWNLGRLPLLLCHPASISHGMNLQAGGNIIIWYGLTWSLEQYLQLNGRLARQGQTKTVVINNIVMEDTIDETVFKVLSNKDAVQKDLLNAMLERYKERC